MTQSAESADPRRDTVTSAMEAHDPSAAEIAALAEAVRAGDTLAFQRAIEPMHPADAANLLDFLPEDDVAAAAELAPNAFTAELVIELAEDARTAVLDTLTVEHIAGFLEAMDSDNAVYLAEALPEPRRAAVFARLDPQVRRTLTTALAFDEETAARLTQREVVAAPEFWSVGQVLEFLRAADDDDMPETFFEIYVVDPGFKPVGAVSLSRVLRSPREAILRDLMTPPPVLIEPDVDQEDIAHVFQKYRLAQAPVVDEAGRLEGMITIDDVVEVIQGETAEDLLALANVSDVGAARGVWRQFSARAPWLLLNLLTALLASAVIALFETTLERIVALAILMPIVTALGGNAGGQALAVAVRSLAARELTAANAPKMIAREAMTAIANGVVIASLLAIAAGMWFSSVTIGLVIGLAMMANFLCAGLAGIMVPLALRRAGADPAVASSVFVTTLTDVVGFFVFLGLATMVLI